MPIDPWNMFSHSFGHMPMPYTAFVTLFDIALFLAVTGAVGRARGKYKVSAPEISGPDGFNRTFRVQQNTMEQLVAHLPLLWIAAFSMSDAFAAAMGAVWLLARILYARGYYAKPKRRFKGFVIGMLVNLVLLITTLSSVLGSL